MCGLCLPHCPTYELTRDEGDSPRGRLALMRGLDQGALPVNDKLLGHLDRCLECRACEAMCPSEVPFARLMDAARARVEPERPRSRHSRRLLQLGRGLLTHPKRLRSTAALLRLYQRSGMQTLVRASGVLRLLGLKRLDGLLPPLSRPLARHRHRATGTERGSVALFSGCVSAVADVATQVATVQVLNALGYRVEIPPGQTCCGALLQHQGEPAGAADLAGANLAAFDPGTVDAIIATASGCSAHLAEYDRLYGGTEPRAQTFTDKVQDITEFLATKSPLQTLALRPLPQTVAVHDPCTLRNGLRQHRNVYRLLEQIPALHTVPLSDTGRCCGAAGSFFLTQPQTANALRDAHIETLRGLNVRTLVSANVGCALHLAAGIRDAGLDIEVIHPVTLLARQMRAAERASR